MSEKKTILLVDDEDHIRAFIRALLRHAGNFHVIEAGDGEEGVRMFADQKPDAVLMDINMPKMDGVEALRKMREIDDQATVIMLTAKATEYAVRECLHAGAANFIRKDTPKERVLELVKETLAEHGLGGET